MGMSSDYEIAVEEGATLVRLGTMLFGARARMSDETFHLTPLDVRRYDFGTALRGYDPTRVDQFREQVAEELERLMRLNAGARGRRPRDSTSSSGRSASATRRSTTRS